MRAAAGSHRTAHGGKVASASSHRYIIVAPGRGRAPGTIM